jgi:hypothetical protein
MKSWLTISSLVQKVFILVGVVIFMTIPKRGRKEYLELGLLLWLALITEVTTLIIIRVFHSNPNAASNIYGLLNFPLAALLYRRRINLKNKNVIAMVPIAIYVLFGLGNILVNGFFAFNTFTMVLEAACFIVMSIAYFYVLIQELPTESISKLPMFWINTANLIYYAGTFVITLSTSYLIEALSNDLTSVWMFHNFLGLVFYSILWYGMLLIRSEYLKRSE